MGVGMWSTYPLDSGFSMDCYIASTVGLAISLNELNFLASFV